jgi:hypothetical protein
VGGCVCVGVGVGVGVDVGVGECLSVCVCVCVCVGVTLIIERIGCSLYCFSSNFPYYFHSIYFPKYFP